MWDPNVYLAFADHRSRPFYDLLSRIGAERARREPYVKALRDIPFRVGAVVQAPLYYANLLLDAGCKVDVWESTYLHQLTGEHPVLDWITGTALVPVRDRLDEESWQQFRRELVPLLDDAYPARADGTTIFPFRRVFIVVQVGDSRRSGK